MKFSDRDLQDIIQVIDSRVERALRQQPRTEYGTVASVSGSKASVKLLGSTASSPGFRVPETFGVAVNDYVRVIISPDGDRYIAENLTQAIVPGALDVQGAMDVAGNLSATGRVLGASAVLRAYKNADQTISTNTWTKLTNWDSLNAARGGLTMNTSNGAINLPRSSWYLVVGYVQWASSSAGEERLCGLTIAGGGGTPGSVPGEEHLSGMFSRGGYTGNARNRDTWLLREGEDTNIALSVHHDAGADTDVLFSHIEVVELSVL